MMKKKNNKKILLIVISFLAVLLIVGVTYASFQFTKTGRKDNVLTLGKLQLTLEEGNEISLLDVLPVSDQVGLASEGYQFTLKNTGSVPVSYSIYLDDEALSSSEEKLDTKFLKYSLDSNGSVGAAQYLDSILTGGKRVLTSGTIAGGKSNTYVLRVWITGDIDADIQRQVWKGRIRLEGTQVK